MQWRLFFKVTSFKQTKMKKQKCISHLSHQSWKAKKEGKRKIKSRAVEWNETHNLDITWHVLYHCATTIAMALKIKLNWLKLMNSYMTDAGRKRLTPGEIWTHNHAIRRQGLVHWTAAAAKQMMLKWRPECSLLRSDLSWSIWRRPHFRCQC